MITVTIRELKRRAVELVRYVHETGEPVQVTYYGKAVARLVPAERSREPEQEARASLELDRLAAEIGARWPGGGAAPLQAHLRAGWLPAPKRRQPAAR